MSSVIFAGDRVRALRSALRLNDQATIFSGSADPTVTPTLGNQGDIYIRVGNSTPAFYQKITSDGTDTNWSNVANAAAGSYTPSTPSNWPLVPATVGDALDDLAIQTFYNSYFVEKRILDSTDISNKNFTLFNQPAFSFRVRMSIIGGIEQLNGTDFNVSGSVLDWNGTSLDGSLEVGDILLITY